jgi:predicted short-subunit dehydrogenase-like oxidoreductase (DUF2520 family)
MKVSILGGGNVAFHFFKALKASGSEIENVYVRDPAKVSWTSCRPLSEVESGDSELLICAVSDYAILEILQRFNLSSFGIVVHCAGAISIDVFDSTEIDAYGVFYPLQTMSKEKIIDYSSLPLYVEGSNEDVESKLISLAKGISRKVEKMSSEARMKAHVAAVFASNFTNYILSIAEDLLQQQDLDRSLLFPLIDETISKFKEHGAAKSQTGPAIRGDQETISKHLVSVNDTTYRQIYQLLTNAIQSKFR